MRTGRHNFFAWTDEWFTGEQEITDWAFGLVTREREPKKAFFALRDKLGQDNAALPHRPLPRTPFVSVIVCSYNGAKTLAACLESLSKLNYPDYEVILVDDGSTDNTRDIAEKFPNARYIYQQNHGLSHARNTGAAAAKGEVFAYTDSDCMADVDWLYYLIGTLVSGDYAGVGGPNVTPPAKDWIQACVAGAPGGPSHVLLTDIVAEHIPGCNMAFYRWAFENVGGFDPEYHKAGDDVDFCWRLQQAGCVIAFSPTAIVWHYRRFTLRAFLKQQEGYGEAESLLRFKHLIFFGPTGTAKWRGQIYGTPRFSWFIEPADYLPRDFWRRIFPIDLSHAAIGSRRLPQQHRMVRAHDFSFRARNFFAGLAHRALSDVWRHALRRALLHGARPDRAEVRYRARAIARHGPRFVQPLVRGWSSYFTWLHFKRTPRSVIATHEHLPEDAEKSGRTRRRIYWSEEGKDRHHLLGQIFQLLEEEGWRYSTDTGWNEWDIQIYGNFWWSITLQTVTEYHGGGKCLTRAALRYRFVTTTVILNLIVLSLLIYHQLNVSHLDLRFIIPYAVFLFFLGTRARALRNRVAELVDVAAYRAGLKRVAKRGKEPLRSAKRVAPGRAKLDSIASHVRNRSASALRNSFAFPSVDV